MPHAKPHEPTVEPAPAAAATKAAPLPVAALAVGGVIAIGGALAATLLWQRGSKPKARATSRKPASKSAPRKRGPAKAKTAS